MAFTDMRTNLTDNIWGTQTQQAGKLPIQPGSFPAGNASQQSSQSSTFHSNPALVDSMARQFQGLYEAAIPSYQGFMADPVGSNVFQTQLQSLLASLAPGEQDARTQLTDRFRAAGGLRSGAHGVSAARLEGDIIGRRQNAAGGLLGQVIGQMTQLLGLPMSQMAPLVNALKLSQQSSQGSSAGWNMNTPSSGGGGGSAPRQPTSGNLNTGVSSAPPLTSEQSSWWEPSTPYEPYQPIWWEPGPSDDYYGPPTDYNGWADAYDVWDQGGF